MRVIGVTGGIASGKNLVTSYLKQKFKCAVFDADLVVHDLYNTDKSLILKIKKHFPAAIEKGRVRRDKISDSLINSPDHWEILEEIVHPIVMKKLHMFICLCKRQHYENAILNIPLLFKVRADKLCNIIISVTTTQKIQRQRLYKRCNYNSTFTKNIINRQNKVLGGISIRTGIEKRELLKQLSKLRERKK